MGAEPQALDLIRRLDHPGTVELAVDQDGRGAGIGEQLTDQQRQRLGLDRDHPAHPSRLTASRTAAR